MKNQCPEIPFFGAPYPDARCVDGVLFDMDNCDENGNLYDDERNIPCPFCHTEEFIELDYFNKADHICLDELMEDDSDEQYKLHIEEAKLKAREWYLDWIRKMRVQF